MVTILCIFVALILIYLRFKPNFDYTEEGNLLLWYNSIDEPLEKTIRKYIRIF